MLRLVLTSIALSGAVLLGCAHGSGAAAAAGAPGDARFTPFDCGRDASSSATEDAQYEAELRIRGSAPALAAEVDYARFVLLRAGRGALVFGVRGEACSGASEPQACLAQVALLEGQMQTTQPSELIVLTTRGDQVALHRGPEQVIGLLGPIDTAADAWLVLMARQAIGPYACAAEAGTGYRTSIDGFELRRRSYTRRCRPVERVELIDQVDRAGNVTRVRETVIERDAERCVVN